MRLSYLIGFGQLWRFSIYAKMTGRGTALSLDEKIDEPT
jgi:hypothetical protein